LLGASPGASVSVAIAIDVIKMCLPQLLSGKEAGGRMKAMIPAQDEFMVLAENVDRFRFLQRETNRVLQLS
jgi:malate dehydrogenase (quinone)